MTLGADQLDFVGVTGQLKYWKTGLTGSTESLDFLSPWGYLQCIQVYLVYSSAIRMSRIGVGGSRSKSDFGWSVTSMRVDEKDRKVDEKNRKVDEKNRKVDEKVGGRE